MILGRFLLWVALAFVCESMVEYLFAPLATMLKRTWPVWDEIQPLKYVSLAVGVALAFAYNLDVIYEAFGFVAAWPGVGVVITGLAIGRGSNFVHDFWTTYLKPGGSSEPLSL